MLFRKRRERAEFKRAVESIEQRVIDHIASGGSFESLLTVVLFEEVLWDKDKQSWYVDVIEGGPSWEGGSSVMDGEKLSVGQRVSLMSGRGGRSEDAEVVSGRKVSVGGSSGYRYLLDFTETGGAEPWFLPLIG